jgi:secreted PhoX family phosphatase
MSDLPGASAPPPDSFWDRMLDRKLSRRTLIRATAAAAFGAAVRRTPLLGQAAAGLVESGTGPRRLRRERFTPIRPSRVDRLILPREFEYRTLIRWKDPVNGRGDWFGFNCDYTAFFPLHSGKRPVAATGGLPDHRELDPAGIDREGLLVVNHEYPDSRFIPKTPDQQYDVGLSVVHLHRAARGRWTVQLKSRYGRRYTGASPTRLAGPAAGLGGHDGAVVGMVGNCSGGVTPWGTFLSCEENTEEYGRSTEDGGYGWGEPYTRVEHYGWVVEVDPYDPDWTPVKRTALGRFHHEAVSLRLGPDNQLVAYMGDDAPNHFLYKYVSEGTYDPKRGIANADLLDRGTLYAAHCRDDGTGAWTALPATEACLRDTHAWILENELPATPMDRPEDVEVHPVDGSIYAALTYNLDPGPGRVLPPEGVDRYGKVARFVEEKGDPTATRFTWEIFKAGGPEAGFAAPDNLEFDAAGNLWITSDFPTVGDAAAPYAPFANNGLFMVPTSGDNAGLAFQFASAPIASELTGPWLTPDETTLFLSVQHPGEGSTREKPSSRWPDGKGEPRPSVVEIRRVRGARI